MKTNKLFILILLTIVTGCQRTLQYMISGKYFGHCVVFVYDSLKNKLNNVIGVEDGLARISELQLNQKFVFKFLESLNDIQIIPIGDMAIAKGERNIF
jgi:hypothetical protein